MNNPNVVKCKERNAIIRLVCIDRYSGFIYRRCSEIQGGEGTDIGGEGEEQSKRHEVKSTPDMGGILKGAAQPKGANLEFSLSMK